MALSEEEKREKLKERKQAYYSLSSDIFCIKEKLRSIENRRGHTIAFQQLMLALDGYEQQISSDFSRYEKQVGRCENKNEVQKLQKALNRERTLREQLENKVKEATESSGLFISYVRKKLKF